MSAGMDINEALLQFDTMRDRGVTLFEISKELGVSLATLRRWERDRHERSLSLRDQAIITPPNVISLNSMSVWKDIGLVLSRLSIGIIACALLIKAAGFIKTITIVLTGSSAF